MKRTTTLLATIAVAALTLACGMGEEGTSAKDGNGTDTAADASGAPEGPTTVKVGKTLVLTDSLLGDDTEVELTVSKPEYKKVDGSGYGKPEHGQFLVVTVNAVVNKGSYHANPFNFKFVAEDGSVYETAFAEFKPALDAVDLNKGQKTSGKVSFDIPSGAQKGGKIALKDSLDEQDLGFWSL